MININPQIIYDDASVRVIWQPGNSEFMLVTFGNLINLANGIHFFGDVPAKKLGYTCIGFMAKNPNWFPKESINKAIASIQEYLVDAAEIITYGGSMGGYAAVKYSASLKAKTVIAFCPQWSIDREECEGRNPGFQEHYSSALAGMGIQSSDISGSVYLFFDPKHSNDVYHANTITNKAVKANHIFVRSVGHLVTGALAGTSNMEDIIRLARANKMSELSHLVNQIRRGHHIRTRLLLGKLSKKHPYLLSKVLSNPSNTEGLKPEEINELRAEAIKSLSATGRYAPALEAIELLRTSGICPVRGELLKIYKQNLSKKLTLNRNSIHTHHQTLLAYSSIEGRLLHCTEEEIFSSLHLIPINSYRYADRNVFGLSLDGKTYLCQIASTNNIKLGNINGVDLRPESLITHTDSNSKKIVPKFRERYITAEKNGTISFNRAIAKEWEFYYLT